MQRLTEVCRIPRGELEMGVKEIGRGSTAQVYGAVLCGHQEVAVKVMHKDLGSHEEKQVVADLQQVRSLTHLLCTQVLCVHLFCACVSCPFLPDVLVMCCQEIIIGTMLPKHPNLPVYVGACVTDDSAVPYVVWERIFGDNLVKLFERQRNKHQGPWQPRYKTLLRWGSQLCSAIACLHSNNLMHRDVKPGNIMVSNDEMTLKLVDYGLCISFSTEPCSVSAGASSAVAGSFRYMAPEIIKQQEYGPAADVYSAAMVMFFMATGDVPYSNLNDTTVAELAARVDLRPATEIIKNEKLSKMLSCAWDADPERRPAAHEMRDELVQLAAVASPVSAFKEVAVKCKRAIVASISRVASVDSATLQSLPATHKLTLTYDELKGMSASTHHATDSSPHATPRTNSPLNLPSSEVLFCRMSSDASDASTHAAHSDGRKSVESPTEYSSSAESARAPYHVERLHVCVRDDRAFTLMKERERLHFINSRMHSISMVQATASSPPNNMDSLFYC